ncbi:metal ABC transporter substrate-binding protein [Halovenus sp. HT40]|uniref:metal ABC transporter substrate-binding protein n=1 Tax=Halovenus sp. HT40 TaxID=3126691 RepID=UPI00300F5C21
MNPTRRQFLSAGAATAVLGTAGCLDVIGLGDEEVDADGYAAFFPLWDFAEHVGGEAMSFTEPVGTGRMGHGWSPDATLVPKVASTEVFVYLDTPEFSWAQDIARTLERDHPDVAVIDLFEVGEAAGDQEGDEHDGQGKDEGSHVDHDPHVWLDPLRAEEMVRTLGEELGEVDPDNESTFADNADAYTAEIHSVDEQLTAIVEEATLDTAVLVGHNSFSYLSNRYDFTLETPVGISPNASASQEDIGNLLDVIDQQGIDTVLYDPFESGASGEYPQLVQTVFENSEVSEAEPLTPLSGTTDQWADNDWGWTEQMTEINIPSLEAALNPA